MRLNMATKFSAAVVGVTVLAIFSSTVALVSLWRAGKFMRQLEREHDQTAQVVQGLVGALLQQKGQVTAYVLAENNHSSLDELTQSKKDFDKWLAAARKTVDSDAEKTALADLETAYRELDAMRDEVLALYQKGDTATAKDALVELSNRRLYEQAQTLCKSLSAASERDTFSIVRRVGRETMWVIWLVVACVILTIGLGTALMTLFFRGVVFPLRHMIADARAFAGQRLGERERLSMDETRAVGIYLRTLMSNVKDTRTALARSRVQLLNTEKLASVGKLAAGVAHEIRNPLTAIKMWLFSIRKTVGVDPELDRRFEIVSEEINRLESIVRNFLEFSRPAAAKLRVESVPTLIDKTLELFAPRLEGQRLRLVRNEAPELPPVLADAEQLRQVFINLLNNAAEAADEGGEVRVLSSAETLSDGRLMVSVRIQNTGRTMPEEVRQRIFEPFFTTKDDGTGLGLCIAARIMEQHQGRLVLEASPPGETSFAVQIPANPLAKR